MNTVWKEGLQSPKFKTLMGDIKTDVLVIGGGITGILCAYMLKNAGVDCVLAEKNTVCSGVTANTTAKITALHGAVYDKMIKRFGAERARLYFKAQNEAIEHYRNEAGKTDCDFEEKEDYIYSLTDREKIEKEVLALERIGCHASFEERVPLPFKIAGAVKIGGQAQFNPIKFLYSVSKDLEIFENTKVLELTPYGAIAQNGKIKAQKTIVATHFPFANKYGGYFLKMYQHRSYVIALENAAELKGMYVDEASTGLSFRNYKKLLLLGGGGHRTGKQGGNWVELRQFAKEYYPNAEEVCHFATQDCKTLDDIPYIGRYSERLPNVYVATGFNKWGMTSAMVAARLLCDLTMGRGNEYEQVFLPSRSIVRPQFFINSFETAKSLLTPTAPRCPHLGCALKYNRDEHSWDCSCHGSRFAENGRLLDNPATGDIDI